MVRFIGLFCCAGLLILILDTAIYVLVTHDAWSLAPRAVTADDETWWQDRFGAVPPPKNHYIVLPPAVPGREGAWYLKRGGHGGSGLSSRPPPAGPVSLIVYDIVPAAPFDSWPVLRGRALASSDWQTGFRVGVLLPFVSRVREYTGPAGAPLPSHDDPEWKLRLRPLAFLANTLIVMVLLGWPILFRDGRAVVRLLKRRCMTCGYQLQGLQSDRCPECGCKR